MNIKSLDLDLSPPIMIRNASDYIKSIYYTQNIYCNLQWAIDVHYDNYGWTDEDKLNQAVVIIENSLLLLKLFNIDIQDVVKVKDFHIDDQIYCLSEACNSLKGDGKNRRFGMIQKHFIKDLLKNFYSEAAITLLKKNNNDT